MLNKSVIVILLLLSTSAVHSFTHTDNWSIPDNQKCDHWGYVSYYKPALNPIIHAGESRKIDVTIPSGAISGLVRYKGHASQPSYLITDVNHNVEFYIQPRLGANVSARFNHLKDHLYIYQNHISNKLNVGTSSMFGVVASFELTQAACDKREGHIIHHKVVVPDLEVKPIILRKDYSFNINQMDIGKGAIYSIQFEYERELNGVYYFKTKSIRPVTVPDYDKDSYTVLGGDCNDDDASINPGAGNCN